MSGAPKKIMKISDILTNNIWDVDYEPHIKVDYEKCKKCNLKACTRLCPASCYTVVGDVLLFSYEGCLECGTCRVICPEGAVKWEYPVSGRGIYYRFG